MASSTALGAEKTKTVGGKTVGGETMSGSTTSGALMSGSSINAARARFLVVVSLVTIFLDQVTKFLAVKHLTHAFAGESSGEGLGADLKRFFTVTHPLSTEPYVVFEWWWDFQYVENPGAAWGLLSGVSENIRIPFFAVVSVVVLGLMLNYYFKSPPELKLRQWALALVVGGAIGNVIDRARMQYVIDFIHWHVNQRMHWPTFNVADAAISIGLVFLLIESFVYPETKKQ